MTVPFRGIAFEGLLQSGEAFAERLAGAFSDDPERSQLVHIATDGETYGHHHYLGDMALAYALHYIEANHLARLTNYGEYLEQNEPAYEVEITRIPPGAAYTAWGAGHMIAAVTPVDIQIGIRPGGRHCGRPWTGCAIRWHRFTKKQPAHLVKDPWAARNDYINVILDRSPEVVDAFLRKARRSTS